MMKNDGNKLKKSLGALDMFSISAGAMISSGLFILPAVVYPRVGPAVIVAYLLASLFVIPSLLGKAELASAMPKSGGVYFYITRSFGPLMGIFSGLAAWFSLSLKSAFALIGVGIFLQPLLADYSPNMIKIVAVACTIVFTILNIVSVKETGRMQIIMVFILLSLILFYVLTGFSHIQVRRYIPFNPAGWQEVLAVTGVIFVSFTGLTKVASVAGEAKSPGKTIPRGMFSAYAIVTVLYVLVVLITVGVLDKGDFSNTLTPVSLGASRVWGSAGFILLASAAMLAFITTANAGLLTASRTPMAMSRDQLLPSCFGRINRKFGTPVLAILITAGFMIICIVFLELEELVKVASTMQLLLFAFELFSVIVMRASKLVSYKPSFKSPLFPVLPIIGILIYIFLIVEMGKVPLFITAGFFIIAVLWYVAYARHYVRTKSAFLHMVGNLTNRELVADGANLEDELLEILRDRD